MAKLQINRSGTTYSSLLVPSSSGLLVKSGGSTLGPAFTSSDVPTGNFLKFTQSGVTKNVYINNNYIQYSAAGASSVPQTGSAGGLLAYGNGIFVFINTTSNVVYTSTTGSSGSWTSRGTPFPGTVIQDLVFIGGAFYASSMEPREPDFGGDIFYGYYRSTNGITWAANGASNYGVPQKPSFYDGTNSIIYFYTTITSPFGYDIYSSSNAGATWTTKLYHLSNPLYLGTIAFINNIYIAIPPTSTGTYLVYTSTFATLGVWDSYTPSWSINQPYARVHSFWQGTAEAKILVYHSNTATNTYYYTSNGTTWTAGTFPNGSTSGYRYFRNIGGLVYLLDSISTSNPSLTSAYVTKDLINWMSVTVSGLGVAGQMEENNIGVFSGVTKSFIVDNVTSGNIGYYVSDGT
jgi:hypothetical protein